MQTGTKVKTFTSIDEALPVLRKLAKEGWKFYMFDGAGIRFPGETSQKDWDWRVEMMRKMGKVNLRLEKIKGGYLFVWKEDYDWWARMALFIIKRECPTWNKINP